jgi:hypothetical protein
MNPYDVLTPLHALAVLIFGILAGAGWSLGGWTVRKLLS